MDKEMASRIERYKTRLNTFHDKVLNLEEGAGPMGGIRIDGMKGRTDEQLDSLVIMDASNEIVGPAMDELDSLLDELDSLLDDALASYDEVLNLGQDNIFIDKMLEHKDKVLESRKEFKKMYEDGHIDEEMFGSLERSTKSVLHELDALITIDPPNDMVEDIMTSLDILMEENDKNMEGLKEEIKDTAGISDGVK